MTGHLRVLAAALLLVLLGGLAGCSPSPREESGPPTKAEGERIKLLVAAIPGVESVELQIRDDWESGRSIMGSVEISPEADAVAVLDDVYATLWSFKSWPPPITMVGRVGEMRFGLEGPIGPGGTYGLSQDELEERYGPWPGPGPGSGTGSAPT